MEKSELYKELEFVRKQIPLFEEKANALEGKNWRVNINQDFDKEAIWSKYKDIIADLKSLLRRSYDAE